MIALEDVQVNEMINSACEAYDLGDLKRWELLRVYTNGVYLIESEKGRFILKVYAADWREESHLRYELHLLVHLKKNNFAVAGVVLDKNGKALHRDYGRMWAVYDYAPGHKPKQPYC
jgi:Ser/Thr protein kinase RdoA (MazF antagonist)